MTYQLYHHDDFFNANNIQNKYFLLHTCIYTRGVVSRVLLVIYYSKSSKVKKIIMEPETKMKIINIRSC